MADHPSDPLDMFRTLLAEAEKSEPNDANAMALATSTPDGHPSLRMVLMKGFDAAGFVFYTNLASRKGDELAANPNAALLFHWKTLRRQVRIEGPIEPVSDAEADAYFASRSRGAQIGAWASDQSRPLEGMFALERRVAEMTVRFGIGPVPRPPHWSGFRVHHQRVEFWIDRQFRLHERILYTRDGSGWRTGHLYP
jgi:pyridoxamine 5'-phosphate oxidase